MVESPGTVVGSGRVGIGTPSRIEPGDWSPGGGWAPFRVSLHTHQVLDRRHQGAVADVDAHRLGQCLGVLLQAEQHGLDLVAAVVDHLQRLGTLGEGVGGEGLVVLEQIGHIGTQARRLHEGRVELVAALVERRERHVEVLGGGDQVRRHLIDGLRQQGHIAQELTELGVVADLERGQLGAVDDRSVDVGTETSTGLGQLVEDHGELGGIDGLEDGIGVGEDLLELEATQCLGDLVALVQVGAVELGRTGNDVDELLAEEGLGADHRLGVGRDLDAVVDPQRDLRLGVDQPDGGHLTDVDAPDVHVAAREEALAGGGERAVDPVAAVVGPEGRLDPDGRQRDEHDQSDGAGDHVAVAIGEETAHVSTPSGSRCCRRPRRSGTG